MCAFWRTSAVPVVLVALVLAFGMGWINQQFGPKPADAASAAPVAAAGPGGQVFVANEASGTISVLDASTYAVVDTICLGSDPAIAGTPQPNGPCNVETDHHRPLYNGQIAPHGLWLTRDGLMLLVTNRLSGTIVGVDTASHRVLGYVPVEREPHLATVRPGGKEAWVAIRGESQLDVLGLSEQPDNNDGRQAGQGNKGRASTGQQAEAPPSTPRRGELFAKIDIVDSLLGPSMVSFTSDGQWAFVVSGKQPLVQKINADTRTVVASQAMSVPFSPFGLVSPDDRELFVVHKLTGTVSILSTSDLSFVVPEVTVGKCANHVFFIGKLAYITVGGHPPPCAPAGAPDAQGQLVILDRTSHRVVRVLSGPEFTGDPHGIWATGDERTLFVGRENANKVTVVDLGNPDDPFDDKVVAQVEVGKQPIDVVVTTHPVVVSR